MVRFILLAILLIIIARMFWRLVDSVMEAARSPREGQGPGKAVKLVRDPVCGTYVPARAALSTTAAGATHYFCSEACKTKFAQS